MIRTLHSRNSNTNRRQTGTGTGTGEEEKSIAETTNRQHQSGNEAKNRLNPIWPGGSWREGKGVAE